MDGCWSRTLLLIEFLVPRLTLALSTARATQLAHGILWPSSTSFILLNMASAVPQLVPDVRPMSRNRWITPCELHSLTVSGFIFSLPVTTQMYPTLTKCLQFCVWLLVNMNKHTYQYHWTHQWPKRRADHEDISLAHPWNRGLHTCLWWLLFLSWPRNTFGLSWNQGNTPWTAAKVIRKSQWDVVLHHCHGHLHFGSSGLWSCND